MTAWTEADRRIGMWSAISTAGIGVVYIILGMIGVLARPSGLSPLSQVGPYLAIMEFLIILAAVSPGRHDGRRVRLRVARK